MITLRFECPIQAHTDKYSITSLRTVQVGPGADSFLQERANRTANVRTRSVSGSEISERHFTRPAGDLNR